MAELTLKQKREWAEQLITKLGYLQNEAAAKVNVSTVTMSKWYNKYGWEKLKQSFLVTKSAQLSRLYMQMDEMNSAILKRPEGERYANSKEADALNKIASTIRLLETDASIAEIVEVGKKLLNFSRENHPTEAIVLAQIFDAFIKNELSK
jgi:uncharacterized protein YjcR